jgi:nucleoside-diphosphate-sugar epimerase
MHRALIGHSGFVGSNLDRQIHFTHKYNSGNIEEIRGQSFDAVYCAGIQAKKWWANQHVTEDWRQIDRLLRSLDSIETSLFVLISTIDVYNSPLDVNEDTPVSESLLSPYGRHRLETEKFVKQRFRKHLIVRLPGLFGEGLKKNVIYDLLNKNELEKIDVRNEFQYYCLDHLSGDIAQALENCLELVNFSTEPIATKEITERFFPQLKLNTLSAGMVRYDMKSKYWKHWGEGPEGYLYSKKSVLSDMEQFIRTYRT